MNVGSKWQMSKDFKNWAMQLSFGIVAIWNSCAWINIESMHALSPRPNAQKHRMHQQFTSGIKWKIVDLALTSACASTLWTLSFFIFHFSFSCSVVLSGACTHIHSSVNFALNGGKRKMASSVRRLVSLKSIENRFSGLCRHIDFLCEYFPFSYLKTHFIDDTLNDSIQQQFKTRQLTTILSTN